MHRLEALNRKPSRWVRSEAQPWIDLALYETMILFYDVVHVLPWSSLALLRQQFFLLQITYGTNVGRIIVHIDYPRRRRVGQAEHLAEEAFGGSDASGLVQEEIQRLTRRIHGSVQIYPLASNLDVGLVHAP